MSKPKKERQSHTNKKDTFFTLYLDAFLHFLSQLSSTKQLAGSKPSKKKMRSAENLIGI